MSNVIQCCECGKRVETDNPISVRYGCHTHAQNIAAFPCSKCKRLHRENGEGLTNWEGERAFFHPPTKCIVIRK